MRIPTSRLFRFSLFALAVAVLPLGGCASSTFGGASAFGTDKLYAEDLAAQDNRTPEGVLVQARARFRNNDFGQSATLYKRAVQMAPEDAEGYVGLSASYDQLGRFDLADRGVIR